MEQSPVSGYLKTAAFLLLTLVVFLAFWQKTKVEDKIVELDRSVADMQETLVEIARSLEGYEPGRQASGDNPRPAWGWRANAALDADLDASRPAGTPGRYRNFLRPDPDGSEAPAEATNSDGTIQLPWGPEPKGFNFLIENYATLTNEAEAYVLDAPGRRHWKEPSSFNWRPSLCWRIEVDPEYREFTLFFRRDAYWQRPNCDLRDYPHLKGKHPVTARDLEFTLNIIQDPQSDCAVSRSYYEKLDRVEVIDDYTAVIHWKETLFTNLAYSIGPTILPQFLYAFDAEGNEYPPETVGQEFNEHWFDQLRVGPVGSGPYRFTKYEPGKYVRMERWDEWYGFKDEPLFPIKVRHLRIYNEPETAMGWLNSGELDIMGLNAARYRSWWLENEDSGSPFKDGRIHVYTAPRPSYFYIAWKNTDPRFSDKRVRKALTHACDRFQICEKIFLGRWKPMASPLYPSSKENDPELKPYPFDLEKSKQLFDEAGWAMNPDTGIREKNISGETIRLEFKLYYPGPNNEYQNAMDHFKNDLLKVGVRMTPQSVQWAQFQKDLEDRKYKAYTLGWALNGYEHDFIQIWHSRGIQDPKSSNAIEFGHPEVDRLSDALRTIMDPKERVAAVRRIGRILYEEQPYTFFAWANTFRGYWNHVHNVEEKPYYFRPFMRTFPFWIETR